MKRECSAQFHLSVAVCLCLLTGCGNDGSGQRVPPAAGLNTSQVEYNPVSLEAIHHVIHGESLSQLIAAPEDLTGLREIRAGSEHVFEGKFNAEGLKSGILRIQFLQTHPKHGEMTTQESGEGLTQDGDFLTYRVPVKAPTTLGKQEAELQYIEFDVTDPENPKTIIHVIAKSTVNVLK